MTTPTPHEGETYLTIAEAAECLRIGETLASELVASGVLPVVELGPKTRRVPRSAMDERLRQIALTHAEETASRVATDSEQQRRLATLRELNRGKKERAA